MACERGSLALVGLADAERRRVRNGVDEKRRCDVLREDRRHWWGPRRELRDLQGTSVKARSDGGRNDDQEDGSEGSKNIGATGVKAKTEREDQRTRANEEAEANGTLMR
jgi:hypothetical protein